MSARFHPQQSLIAVYPSLDRNGGIPFDDDVQIDDDQCPKCGADYTLNRHCTDIGCEDGYQNRHEEDPNLYDPEDWFVCDVCQGHGYHHWCSCCGWDLIEKRYIGLPIVRRAA